MNKQKIAVENVIEVDCVSKKFVKKEALKKVSFKIKRGEIVGLLGNNGAGKTTLMNIMTGCGLASSGRVRICGYDVVSNPIEAKKHIGYLPENPPLYFDLSVREYLTYVCELKQILKVESEIKRVCELWELKSVENKLISKLSKGFKQRVGLAQSVLGNPSVLILDEPTSGLDPSKVVQFRETLQSLSEGRTIIFSTHILSEVQQTCNRVIAINDGVILGDDSKENFVNKRTVTYELEVEAEKESIISCLEGTDVKLEGLELISGNIYKFKLTPIGSNFNRVEISKILAGNGILILKFAEADASSSVEKAFVELLDSSGNDGRDKINKDIIIEEKKIENENLNKKDCEGGVENC